LMQDPGVAIFADVAANLHGLATAPAHADVALNTADKTTLARLQPDLVINFGGQVTSKNIKTLLRRHPPQALWHVRPSLVAPDTYQALTDVVPMQPAPFFQQLAARLPSPAGSSARLASTTGYQADWRALNERAAAALQGVLRGAPYSEMTAVEAILAHLPQGSLLQIGNSMPIRYANILGVHREHSLAQVNSNRGTSGIDGTVSTAVGAALATNQLVTLLVGDLGFFYDRNGLWHRHLPPNLGIFDIIDGPNRLERERQETYFLTPQPLTARRTAEDHELRYFHATSSAELHRHLPQFFASGERPALLEIETEMATNTAVYAQFKAATAALHLDSF
jgi:2-succinyl-5-enolpyruvyl-6-hydroxy-3-cyclohexene-1-carboxylate synthase